MSAKRKGSGVAGKSGRSAEQVSASAGEVNGELP